MHQVNTSAQRLVLVTGGSWTVSVAPALVVVPQEGTRRKIRSPLPLAVAT